MGKSSHDITPVTKMRRIRLLQNYDLADGEQSDVVLHEQEIVIPNVKAYKLFDAEKSPLQVTAELNLPGPQVQQFYVEYPEYYANVQACYNITKKLKIAWDIFLNSHTRKGKRRYS